MLIVIAICIPISLASFMKLCSRSPSEKKNRCLNRCSIRASRPGTYPHNVSHTISLPGKPYGLETPQCEAIGTDEKS